MSESVSSRQLRGLGPRPDGAALAVVVFDKKTSLAQLALVLFAMLLASCGGDVRDGPPPRELDASSIPDAVPRYEPVTKAGNKSPYVVLGKKYYVLPSSKNYRAKGKASWYGTKFHGRTTSNGEKYDMYSMTAAHKTLPIPCYVQVTNLDNGRRAIVRVNDRGPFHDNRIIDLSYAAAKKLGVYAAGTSNVEVVAIDPASFDPQAYAQRPLASTSGNAFLQLGAFSSPDAAESYRLKALSKTRHSVAVYKDVTGGKTLFKVLVGPFPSHNTLLAVKDKLQRSDNLASFVVYR